MIGGDYSANDVEGGYGEYCGGGGYDGGVDFGGDDGGGD